MALVVLWEQRVAGSNPATPTLKIKKALQRNLRGFFDYGEHEANTRFENITSERFINIRIFPFSFFIWYTPNHIPRISNARLLAEILFRGTNILRSLQKGQSKYSLIVTGQIFHHSGKGNTKANIISELKNEKYVPHIIGSNPKDLLTSEKTMEGSKYLIDKNKR